MARKQILIVSTSLKKSELLVSPFDLLPEQFTLCGYEALKFIGFSQFHTVFFHSPPEDQFLKLSLGIKDNSDLEGLWAVVNQSPPPALKAMVEIPAPPPRPWIDLGIEPVLRKEVKNLADKNQHLLNDAVSPADKVSLTADDIRERYQRGERSLPEGRLMTPWAREVADSLGMSITPSGENFAIVRIQAGNKAQLKTRADSFFAWNSRSKNILVLLPPPLIPVFRDMFPSLKGMVISPTCHWADQGAFTGEVSLSMIVDMECRGFILPPVPPYTIPGNLKKLLPSAAKKGLLVFSTFSLDQKVECDIITELGEKASGTPLIINLLSFDERLRKSDRTWQGTVAEESEFEFENWGKEL